MLHTLRFSLQNAVYFIVLPFLVTVFFTFYIQVCYNLNVKLGCQKVKQVLTSSTTRASTHNTPSYDVWFDTTLLPFSMKVYESGTQQSIPVVHILWHHCVISSV
jgi:hypothetical protein